MSDEESLSREVEEARVRLGAELLVAPGSAAYFDALDALVAAVRKQERAHVLAEQQAGCRHMWVSAVGGPVMCGLCGAAPVEGGEG